MGWQVCCSIVHSPPRNIFIIADNLQHCNCRQTCSGVACHLELIPSQEFQFVIENGTGSMGLMGIKHKSGVSSYHHGLVPFSPLPFCVNLLTKSVEKGEMYYKGVCKIWLYNKIIPSENWSCMKDLFPKTNQHGIVPICWFHALSYINYLMNQKKLLLRELLSR